MIYLITKQQSLFESDLYKTMTVEESLKEISNWKVIQVDSETSGGDAHICDFLCVQLGNDEADKRLVIDTATVDIKLYKEALESKLCILQNAKFDLKFFFKHDIIIRKVYDTMIVEQLLHLGFPHVSMTPFDYDNNGYTFPYHVAPNGDRTISFALDAISDKRLGVDIDKSVRGEIHWRGLDDTVILYAAGDVTYLEKIMWSQVEDLRNQGLMKAAKIECDFIPAISYLEWCGIHLDQERWKAKMVKDQKNLDESIEALNRFVISNPAYKQFTFINPQGDLFEGFDLTPKCTILWSSSDQVVKFAKFLGFDTKVQDKKTGEDKDSVMEKHLKKQKGINDEFLRLYFGKGEEGDDDYYAGYSGSFKVVSSFGQGHLNAINPLTNRIHTNYKQLGASSGRMSCGSQEPNKDLAALNKVSPKDCTYPNMQQLPSDEETRACFTAPKEYKWSSCDYSALESRLGADIYNEKSMLDEFLHGSGDMHSLCAYMVYKDVIPRDTPIKDIKKKFPHQRKHVKPIEFSQQFGGSEYAIQNAMGCTIEEARAFKEAYDSGFPGIADFKKKGSEFVRKYGYILMCKYSGHKMYWWDHKEWIERQKKFTQEFWEEYRTYHKGTGDSVAKEVSQHFKAASKWDRMALNSPTQGSGSVILKIAMTNFFNWIVDKGYFGKVEIAALVHDESNIIYPEELTDVPIMQKKCMEDAAALICTKLPIPAEAEVADCWKH